MANSSSYQVAVIGGGLAGLCTAIQCAQAGYSTVLFEKEHYPFHKVCGEYISMESFSYLQTLGFDPAEYALPRINDLLVSGTTGKTYRFPLQLGGFGVSRYLLDHALYRRGVETGVTGIHTKVQDVVFDNDSFLITTLGGSYSAKVAVGSFGKRSNLDVRWARTFTRNKGGTNYIGVKYHIRFPHPPGQIALHNFKDGYCGMSAIEDGKTCLCYLTTAQNLQAAGSIPLLQEKVLNRNPHLQKIFTEAEILYREPLTISQVSFAPKTVVHNHILMAGDAAGLITPLCGNGMSMAMHAGKIVFEVVGKFLGKKVTRQQMESDYQARWRQMFSRRLDAGRLVQRFFGRPVLTNFFLNVMNTLPPLSRAIIRSTHGEPF